MSSKANEFEAKKVLLLLYRHKIFIGIFTLLITIIAGIYIYRQPLWYAAKTNVVPPKKGAASDGGISAVSAALKDIGMAKIGGKSGDAYSIMALFMSRSLEDSVINKFKLGEVYEIPDSNMSAIRKQLEGNMEILMESEGNYTITAWHKDKYKAAEMANYIVEALNSIALNLNHQETRINIDYMENKLAKTDSLISALGLALQKYSSSKMAYSPLDQGKAIASALTELKADYLKQDLAYNLAKNNYGENDPMVINQKNLVEQLKLKINQAENKPGFAGNFAVKDAAGVGVTYMSIYSEIEALMKLKAMLLPTLEQSKMDEIRNSKELLILDKAIPPEVKDRPRRSIVILGALAGSLLTAIMLVLFFDAIVRFKKYMQSEQ